MKKATVIIFLFIGISISGFSKSDFYSVWLDYTHYNKLKNNWFLQSDYGYRFRLDYTYNWQRMHLRTGLGYTFKKARVLSGVALFTAYQPNQILDLELRPWQGVKFKWKPAERFQLTSFVRLEERIHFLGTPDGQAYNYFLLIFRYALMAKYAINLPKDGKGAWVGFIGFEPFIKLYEKNTPIVVSKSRTTVGMSYSPSKKTKFKLGYIYQPKNIPMMQETEHYANIIRLSVVQKF